MRGKSTCAEPEGVSSRSTGDETRIATVTLNIGYCSLCFQAASMWLNPRWRGGPKHAAVEVQSILLPGRNGPCWEAAD